MHSNDPFRSQGSGWATCFGSTRRRVRSPRLRPRSTEQAGGHGDRADSKSAGRGPIPRRPAARGRLTDQSLALQAGARGQPFQGEAHAGPSAPCPVTLTELDPVAERGWPRQSGPSTSDASHSPRAAEGAARRKVVSILTGSSRGITPLPRRRAGRAANPGGFAPRSVETGSSCHFRWHYSRPSVRAAQEGRAAISG